VELAVNSYGEHVFIPILLILPLPVTLITVSFVWVNTVKHCIFAAS